MEHEREKIEYLRQAEFGSTESSLKEASLSSINFQIEIEADRIEEIRRVIQDLEAPVFESSDSQVANYVSEIEDTRRSDLRSAVPEMFNKFFK